MIWPITSQTIRRNQLLHPSEYIMAKFQTMPRIGTSGTSGVRNGRGVSGCARRITQTPAHTMTKANRVPMLVISPTTESGRKAEKGDTKSMNKRFERHGVRNFGWMSEKTLGTRPSRDMEKNTRLCPSSITSMTEVNPQMMPNLMRNFSHSYGV